MTSIKRRIFLKGSLAAGAVGAAVGAGLLTPRAVLAAWPSDAFSAKAVVPITVETNMPGVERIAIVAAGNPFPLTSAYDLGPTALPYVSTRIRMAKTSDVIAVVKAGGKLYSARKSVKVTIGGCGG